MLAGRKPIKPWPGAFAALGPFCLVLAACGPDASAEPLPPPPDNPLTVFQAKEDRLFRIGYALASANARYCRSTRRDIGILVHDARAYSAPAAVRTHFRLSGDLGVQSVAPQSPSSSAGIEQNDTLVSIDGLDVSGITVAERNDWQRARRVAELIEASALDGEVRIGWRRGSSEITEKTLLSESICASRFELLSGKDGASADGERVLIGEDFPGLAYPEAELAALLAHEMAHNLLDHIDYLSENGRGNGKVRITERDADRLMPWLLANAGYDPRAAADFMRRWGPRHGGWIFRKRSHDGWDERVELIETELPLIAAVTVDGSADWASHFTPFLEAAER